MTKRQKKNKNVTLRVKRSMSLQYGNENALPIPIDIIIMIFSKLPLKSIARCRCVLKLWASILRRSDFTELFFSRSCSETPKLLFAYEKNREFFFYSSPQPQNPDANSSPVVPKYQIKFPFDACYCENGDLVNGLICLQYKMLLKICNPSTGQVLALPKVQTDIDCMGSLFGYDPIGKQFKVLVMTMSEKHHTTCDRYHVLTLGCGKLSWRRLECCIPHNLPWNKICIGGMLYYTSIDRTTETCIIVCFDVRFEKFSLVKTIDSAMMDESTELINYNGKLGLLKYEDIDFDGRSVSYKLWVLDDLENQVWSENTFLFPNVPKNTFGKGNLFFVGVTQINEIVLSSSYPSQPFYLYYLNLEKKTIVRVTVRGMEEAKYDRFILLDHVENVKFYGSV